VAAVTYTHVFKGGWNPERPSGITISGPGVRTPQRQAVCRYCDSEIVLGKHGWHSPFPEGPHRPDGTNFYHCPKAPRGYHGKASIDDTPPT
jgi:hypothetical protein